MIVSGEAEGNFDPEQYTAYRSLIEKWDNLQRNILDSILAYYKQIRFELGYDIELNGDYPLIETTNQLLENITLLGISVPDNELSEILDIGLLFDCTWDLENGLGLSVKNGEVTEVGYQDIVI